MLTCEFQPITEKLFDSSDATRLQRCECEIHPEYHMFVKNGQPQQRGTYQRFRHVASERHIAVVARTFFPMASRCVLFAIMIVSLCAVAHEAVCQVRYNISTVVAGYERRCVRTLPRTPSIRIPARTEIGCRIREHTSRLSGKRDSLCA